MEGLLVTGVKSGFGKFVYEQVKGEGLTRENSNELIERLKMVGVKEIIHCAFNPAKNIQLNYNYIDDNVFLTRELVKIPHKTFVFISTVEVYPNDGKRHSESEEIIVDKVSNIYGITKLMSEEIIRQGSKNHLIFRCSGLLGKYSRKGNLVKLLEEENPELTFAGNSELNYVLYKDVLDCIQFLLKEKLNGTYNISSSTNITLEEVAEMIGKKVTFGNFVYRVGNTNNSKAATIFPAFRKTSKDVIREFTLKIKKGKMEK